MPNQISSQKLQAHFCADSLATTVDMVDCIMADVDSTDPKDTEATTTVASESTRADPVASPRGSGLMASAIVEDFFPTPEPVPCFHCCNIICVGMLKHHVHDSRIWLKQSTVRVATSKNWSV